MKRYVFISNSTKPKEEVYKSRDKITLSNVSRPCVTTALDMGYEVYHGVNRYKPEELECEFPINLYESHTYRSITAFKDNKIAYKNLCKVLSKGNFEAMHCNTPIGGLVGRLAGKKYKVKKIIYTAHGFHFYKGAPLFNRTILKWAEKWLAHRTDAIITMNQEDYEAAKKFRLKKGGKVYFVHGVGVNLDRYDPSKPLRETKRAELNLKNDDVMLISMGDLVARKNYSVAIKAIAKTGKKNLHYFICGKGGELANLEALAKELGVEEQIHFLGFRRDVAELLQAADIFLFTTKQEGLPRSMMEAMATGLACVASKIRGNVDLIKEGEGGFLCPSCDVEGFAKAISTLEESPEMREAQAKYNLEVIKGYDVKVVEEEIKAIYAEVLGE